jgi:hypothetical protein
MLICGTPDEIPGRFKAKRPVTSNSSRHLGEPCNGPLMNFYRLAEFSWRHTELFLETLSKVRLIVKSHLVPNLCNAIGFLPDQLCRSL